MTPRRSEWRMRADDPKTPFGWWIRSVANQELSFALAILGGFVGLGLAALDIPAALILTPLFCLPLAVETLTGRARRDQLGQILPVPALPGQFRTTVAYRRKGLKLGHDEMAITIVDGWLVGEGLRTEFALRPRDVLIWDLSARGATLTLSGKTVIRLHWNSEANGRALSEWRSSTGPRNGEPILPPAGANAQEMARWKAWSIVGGFLILMAGVRFPSWANQGADGLLFFLVTMGCGGALLQLSLMRLRQLGRLTRRRFEAPTRSGLSQRDAK